MKVHIWDWGFCAKDLDELGFRHEGNSLDHGSVEVQDYEGLGLLLQKFMERNLNVMVNTRADKPGEVLLFIDTRRFTQR